MSQVTYPTTSSASVRSRHAVSVVAWAAAIAAMGGTLFVLALSIDWSNGAQGGRAASQHSLAVPGGHSSPLIRFDGGPQEGTRGVLAQPSVRFDGGPQEGTRGVLAQPSVRFDGGPQEGTRGAIVSQATTEPPLIEPKSFDRGPRAGGSVAVVRYTPPSTVDAKRFDGGPDEGTRGH